MSLVGAAKGGIRLRPTPTLFPTLRKHAALLTAVVLLLPGLSAAGAGWLLPDAPLDASQDAVDGSDGGASPGLLDLTGLPGAPDAVGGPDAPEVPAALAPDALTDALDDLAGLGADPVRTHAEELRAATAALAAPAAQSLPPAEVARFASTWTDRFTSGELQAYLEHPGSDAGDGFEGLEPTTEAALVWHLVDHWVATLPGFADGVTLPHEAAEDGKVALAKLVMMVHAIIFAKDELRQLIKDLFRPPGSDAVPALPQADVGGTATPGALPELAEGTSERFPGWTQAQIDAHFAAVHAEGLTMKPMPAPATIPEGRGVPLAVWQEVPVGADATSGDALTGLPALPQLTQGELPEPSGTFELHPDLDTMLATAPQGPPPADLPDLDELLERLADAPAEVDQVVQRLLGLLETLTYRACGRMGDEEPVCSLSVPVGLPVVLDVDGAGGPDVMVLLAPSLDPEALLDGKTLAISKLPILGPEPFPAEVFVVFDEPVHGVRLTAGLDARGTAAGLPMLTEGHLQLVDDPEVPGPEPPAGLDPDVEPPEPPVPVEGVTDKVPPFPLVDTFRFELTSEAVAEPAAVRMGYARVDASAAPALVADPTVVRVALDTLALGTTVRLGLQPDAGLLPWQTPAGEVELRVHADAPTPTSVGLDASMVRGATDHRLTASLGASQGVFLLQAWGDAASGVDHIAMDARGGEDFMVGAATMPDTDTGAGTDGVALRTLGASMVGQVPGVEVRRDGPRDVRYGATLPGAFASTTLAAEDRMVAASRVALVAAMDDGAPLRFHATSAPAPLDLVIEASGEAGLLQAVMRDDARDADVAAVVEAMPHRMALELAEDHVEGSFVHPARRATAELRTGGESPWVPGEPPANLHLTHRTTGLGATAASVHLVWPGAFSAVSSTSGTPAVDLHVDAHAVGLFQAQVDVPDRRLDLALRSLPRIMDLHVDPAKATLDQEGPRSTNTALLSALLPGLDLTARLDDADASTALSWDFHRLTAALDDRLGGLDLDVRTDIFQYDLTATDAASFEVRRGAGSLQVDAYDGVAALDGEGRFGMDLDYPGDGAHALLFESDAPWWGLRWDARGGPRELRLLHAGDAYRVDLDVASGTMPSLVTVVDRGSDLDGYGIFTDAPDLTVRVTPTTADLTAAAALTEMEVATRGFTSADSLHRVVARSASSLDWDSHRGGFTIGHQGLTLLGASQRTAAWDADWTLDRAASGARLTLGSSAMDLTLPQGVGTVAGRGTDHGSFLSTSGRHASYRELPGGRDVSLSTGAGLDHLRTSYEGGEDRLLLRGAAAGMAVRHDLDVGTDEGHLDLALDPVPASFDASFGNEVSFTASQSVGLSGSSRNGHPNAIAALALPAPSHGLVSKDADVDGAQAFGSVFAFPSAPLEFTMRSDADRVDMDGFQPPSGMPDLDLSIDRTGTGTNKADFLLRGIQGATDFFGSTTAWTNVGDRRNVQASMVSDARIDDVVVDFVRFSHHGRFEVEGLKGNANGVLSMVAGQSDVTWNSANSGMGLQASYRVEVNPVPGKWDTYHDLDNLPTVLNMVSGSDPRQRSMGALLNYAANAPGLTFSAAMTQRADFLGTSITASYEIAAEELGRVLLVRPAKSFTTTGPGFHLVSFPETKLLHVKVGFDWTINADEKSDEWSVPGTGGIAKAYYRVDFDLHARVKGLTATFERLNWMSFGVGIVNSVNGVFKSFKFRWDDIGVDVDALAKAGAKFDFPSPLDDAEWNIVNVDKSWHVSANAIFHKYQWGTENWKSVSGGFVCDVDLSITRNPKLLSRTTNEISISGTNFEDLRLKFKAKAEPAYLKWDPHDPTTFVHVDAVLTDLDVNLPRSTWVVAQPTVPIGQGVMDVLSDLAASFLKLPPGWLSASGDVDCTAALDALEDAAEEVCRNLLGFIIPC